MLVNSRQILLTVILELAKLRSEEKMEFVIARHCLTDWNAEGRLQGHMDQPLNAAGRIQAEQLGERLSREFTQRKITRIWTSDLRRAQETASIIAKELGIKKTFSDRRLREFHFGELEGRLHDEINEQFGEILVRYPASEDFRRFGGESSREVISRYHDAFRDICRTCTATDLPLVIGHGRSLRSFLDALDCFLQDLSTQGTYHLILYRS